MADGAVNFLLDKLTFTLVQEASLLGDAQNAIEEIKLELESMRSLMKDAERSKEKSESVKTWVGQVRDVAYEVEDIIDEFLHNTGLKHHSKGFLQAILYFPQNMTARRKIHSKLQKIKAKAYEVSERSNRYGFERTGEVIASSNRWQNYGESSRLVEEDDVVGMDENAEKLVEWLTEAEPRRTIISVVGMGGLGKTTLVTEVYNDQMIKRHFNCCAWISVTQAYGAEDLLRSMIKELLETNQGMVSLLNNLGTMKSVKLLETLFDNLQEKRYLIVLDDVWSIDLWNLIRSAFPNNQNGSRIILTTRNENVPASVGKGSRVYRLHPLEEYAAWTLFCKKAFWDDPTDHSCPMELQTLARSIVNKCEGLPLAIIAIGGLMSSRKKTVVEWNKINESLNWQLSNNVMLERVKAILMLSLNDLPFYL